MGNIKGDGISSEPSTLLGRETALKDSVNLHGSLLFGRADFRLAEDACLVNPWAYLFMCCVSSN